MPSTYLIRRYESCNCTKRHRTFRAMARCIWRRACWITGNGPYASVSNCGATTVMLYSDMLAAHKALEFIDELGCGGQCFGNHTLFLIGQIGDAA